MKIFSCTLCSFVLSFFASGALACSPASSVSLSFVVQHADLVVSGTITGQSVYERERIGSLISAEVSTVVFDVDRALVGESPATLEFIVVDLADVITRNLGNHFVVALEYPENPFFVADDRFAGSSALPSMVRTDCANYLFATEWPDNLPSRFLFEIYDGDGDPAAEAAVFDRFLRGSGLF